MDRCNRILTIPLSSEYVDDDEKRKTSDVLKSHVDTHTLLANSKIAEAAQLIRQRMDSLMNKHEEMMAASHAYMVEASRLYKEAVDRHVVSLQTSVQSGAALAQGFTVEAEKVKKKTLSSYVVPPLKLDDKELGFVKQLKELQEEHRVLQVRYEHLQASKGGAVEQLNSAREVNREALQVIADLEERIKILNQDKLGLELRQNKLVKEVETLKRKRRDSNSPSPAQSAFKLRILRRGETESPTPKQFSLSPKKSRNRTKSWDQPAPGQEKIARAKH
jgi:hypothetical protein